MSIDWWTLGLEAINVAVLVWLLGRFFWRPVAAVIEKRRQSVAADLAQVETGRRELDAAAKKIAATRAGFAAERETVLASAREEAGQQRQALLARARDDAEALRETARKEMEATRATERKAWAERSGRLAVTIAGRLAARLDGTAVRAAFLDWLVEAIDKLPEATRAAITDGNMTLKAVTARTLEAVEQRQVSEALAAALGCRPAIAFETDPTLIEGIELHGPHFTLRNSWRSDLDGILQEISHDE